MKSSLIIIGDKKCLSQISRASAELRILLSLEDFDEIMNSFALVQVTERRRRVVAGAGTIIRGHFGVGISLENKGSKI